MLGYLYRLFIGNFKSCNHVWEIYSKDNITRISVDSNLHNTIIGTEYILKCKHCGNLKREYFQVY